MDKSTQQDFHTAIQRHGYIPDDFNFVETDTTKWNTNELSTITGTILVTLNKTGKSKEYRTGTGTKWVIDFESDLNSGQFS